MTKTRLGYLLIALVVLGVVFVLSDRGRTGGELKQVALFGDVQGAEIARVKLENGENVTELILQDGAWQLPSRNGYPADSGKVRAFLLRLLDITLTQLVTSDPTKYEALGVSDDSVKKNSARITIVDSEGKELGSVIFGDSRKKGEGRFIRKGREADVFLVSNASQPDLTPTYWLKSEVVNILPSQVKRLQQFLSSDTGINREFELVRTGIAGAVSLSEKTEKPLPQSKIDEVIGSFQALQLTDVFPAGSERGKNLKFDGRVVLHLKNGLIYTLSTASSDGKSFLKGEVAFDQTLAEELKREWESEQVAQKEREEREQAEKAATDGGSSEGQQSKSAPRSEEASKPQLPLSSSADAAELQKNLAPWIFEIQSFQADKLRRKLESLLVEESAVSEGGEEESQAGQGVTVRPFSQESEGL